MSEEDKIDTFNASEKENPYSEHVIQKYIFIQKKKFGLMMNQYNNIISKKYDDLMNKLEKQYNDLLERFEGDLQNDINADNFNKIVIEEKKVNISKLAEADAIIQKGISLTFENLCSYIDSIDLEKHDNNVGSFISKALFNELLIQEDIDFTGFTLDFDNKQISEGVNDCISQKVVGDNISYSITEETTKERDTKFIHENSNTIAKLEFINVKNQVSEYFKNPKWVFRKLKSIHFKDCIFKVTEKYDDSIKESERFPSLTNLSFINSFPPQSSQFCCTILPPLSITSSLPHIQILRFEKSHIVNSEFNKIMSDLIFSTILGKTLKILSFADNCLTSVDFQKIIIPNNALESLEELNLSNNRLYVFKCVYQYFPRLQLVNLIDNHFSNITDLSLPKKIVPLVLTNRNFYLSSKTNMSKYYDSLKEILPDLKYRLQYMNFSGLFNRFNNQNILNLVLSPVSYLTLTHLDLSYCGLNTDIAIEFLIKNKIIKLKSLNLKSNFIGINIFEKYVKTFNDSIGKKRFIYLEDINLSNNSIENEEFKYVYEFIKIHKNLKHLNLQMNSFSKDYYSEKKDLKKNQLLNGQTLQCNIGQIEEMKSPVYIIEKEPKVNGMDFCDVLRELYQNEKKTRKFFMDFSTDNRMLNASTIEKNHCTYLIKPKDKNKQK